jgi:hypothetical protein
MMKALSGFMKPAVVSALAFTSACAGPQAVTLSPLPDHGSSEERATYRQAMTGQVVHAPTPFGHEQTFLLLGDGTRVIEPEDLLPVVGTKTTSGRAALRATRTQKVLSESLTTATLAVSAIGTGFAVGGLSVMVAAIANPDAVVADQLAENGFIVASVGLGVLAGSIALSAFDAVLRQELARERATAFAAYNQSLDAQLAAAEVAPVSAPDAGPPESGAPAPGHLDMNSSASGR